MCSMRSICLAKLSPIFANRWSRAITKVCFPFCRQPQKRNGNAMLWEIDIHPADGERDRAGERVAAASRELGVDEDLQVGTARGYLLEGDSLQRADVERLANELLVDSVVEQAVVGRVGEPFLT